MNQGVDRGRGPALAEPLFSDNSSASNSTRYFEFRKNSNSISPSSFPKFELKRSIEFEDDTDPALAAHP
jgi:hypothetical protein